MAIKLFILLISFSCIQTQYFNCLHAQETSNQNRKPKSLNRIDTLQLNVDDHKMSMYVSGEGKYTVILEAGGSSNHRCWRAIDTQIAKLTRVISYDRPDTLNQKNVKNQEMLLLLPGN